MEGGTKIRLGLSKGRRLSFFFDGVLVGSHPLVPDGELYPAVVSQAGASVKIISVS
jgi:hypothetical protein